MVRDPSIPFPKDTGRIDRATRAAENLYLDAQWISERLFGDHLPTNLVMLGAAYQHGCLPVTAGAIEEAISLNGAGAPENRAAFRWGRAAVIDPAAVTAALTPAAPPAPAPPASLRRILGSAPAALADVLDARAADLAGYQSDAYARRYLEEVLETARIEERADGRPRIPGDGRLRPRSPQADGLQGRVRGGASAPRLDPAGGGRRRIRRGSDDQGVAPPARTQVTGADAQDPPGTAAAGPVFRILRAGRHLRGTALDPFGLTNMRRTERALVDEYRTLVSRSLEQLTPASVDMVTAIADVGR